MARLHYKTEQALTLKLISTLAVLCLAIATAPALAGQVPDGLSKDQWASIKLQIVTNDHGNDPSFEQQAYVKASNTESNDRFGWSVAISGNTLVVATPFENSNAIGINGDQSNSLAPDSGAAYVFTRNGTEWSQQAYLKASNTESVDQFGISVAISGDTLVVGADREDSDATGVNGDQGNNLANQAGAAYVFTRDGTEWSQQAYLKASNSGFGDRFGISVAISGETLVVGAEREGSDATGVNGDQGNDLASQAGAAYVFTRNGTEWSQQVYLKASNSGFGDRFGLPVAISGDTIVVGAISEDSDATGINGNQSDNTAPSAGAAYVFTRNGTEWSQQAYLKASNTESIDQFGISAAISGDTLVVGADREDSNATGVNGDQGNNLASQAGAAYVFARNGTEWSQQAYLKDSSSRSFNKFGISVGISGGTAVVGGETGIAYIFTRSGMTWSQQAAHTASNTDDLDGFGMSVAISGDTLVVGAIGEDSNATGINGDQSNKTAPNAGAAYVLTRFTINPGLNDAWFNPDTIGQGFFIIVFPDIKLVFLAWFTYDTDRPSEDVTAILGEPGHRWITAQGPFEGDTATLDVFLTAGGVFDSVEPAPDPSVKIGTMKIVWADCKTAVLTYDIPDLELMGEVPLQRIALDNVALCEALNEQYKGQINLH